MHMIRNVAQAARRLIGIKAWYCFYKHVRNNTMTEVLYYQFDVSILSWQVFTYKEVLVHCDL